MTNCRRGAVVLVKFVFSDERGIKQRPVLILSGDAYHQDRQEAIVAAVTSNTNRMLVGDYKIKNWREAGLLFPSTVTGIIRTIKQDMIIRNIGDLPSKELAAVGDKLRDVLQL